MGHHRFESDDGPSVGTKRKSWKRAGRREKQLPWPPFKPFKTAAQSKGQGTLFAAKRTKRALLKTIGKEVSPLRQYLQVVQNW